MLLLTPLEAAEEDDDVRAGTDVTLWLQLPLAVEEISSNFLRRVIFAHCGVVHVCVQAAAQL